MADYVEKKVVRKRKKNNWVSKMRWREKQGERERERKKRKKGANKKECVRERERVTTVLVFFLYGGCKQKDKEVDRPLLCFFLWSFV